MPRLPTLGDEQSTDIRPSDWLESHRYREPKARWWTSTWTWVVVAFVAGFVMGRTW